MPTALSTEQELSNLIARILRAYVKWVPAERYEDFLKLAKTMTDFDSIDNAITKRQEDRRAQKLNQLIGIVGDVIALSPEDKQKLKNAFSQNHLIQRLL